MRIDRWIRDMGVQMHKGTHQIVTSDLRFMSEVTIQMDWEQYVGGGGFQSKNRTGIQLIHIIELSTY